MKKINVTWRYTDAGGYELLKFIRAQCSIYGCISVADYYKYLFMYSLSNEVYETLNNCTYKDTTIGWRSLASAYIDRGKYGYTICMPEPVNLCNC